LKIKKPKKPKNLTFQVFRFFLKPKKPRFFKMGLNSPDVFRGSFIGVNTVDEL